MSDGKSTLYIPALGGIYKSLDGLAVLSLRVICGALLIPHGLQKLFGMFGGSIEGTGQFFSNIGLEPGLALAYYVGILELVGGIFLVIGLFTRLVAIQVVGFMLIGAFYFHWGIGGFFWTDKGAEYLFMWAVLAFYLVIRGGGNMSVDKMLGKEF